jgi:predicted aspartyl protease
MKLRIWSFLIAFVGFTALFGWAQNSDTTSMPFQLKDGYLVLAKGSIGGLNNLIFLLDTGTSRTLLDTRIAKRLHLEGVAHSLTVFDREVEARLVVLPDLQLGAIHAVAPQVIAMDLSGSAQRLGLYTDAILGMDILHRSSFSIDYRSKRIWFNSREPIASDVSLDTKSQPYLIVFARIDGLPVRLMIDTGCENGMLFANRLPNGLTKDYVQMSRGLTVAGESPLTQIVSVRLAVGSSPAHRVRFPVVETGNNDMGYAGVVGVRALHASRIDFNFERMTISWK